MEALFNYAVVAGWRIHVEPLISSGKKALLVLPPAGKLVYLGRVDSGDVEAYASYYARCSGRVPGVSLLYVGKTDMLVEYVEGETAGDKLLHVLALGDLGEAFRLVRGLGAALRGFHGDLEACPGGIRSSKLEEVVGERCSLALSVARPGEYMIIKDVCERLDSLLKEPLSCRGAAGHGDLHLYQVLVGDRIYLVDPGGEPDTVKLPCLEYDLASLARSIEYAVDMASPPLEEASRVRIGLVGELFAGYDHAHIDPGALRVLYLTRTLYEYYYERTRGTGLDWIPIKALREYCDSRITLVERVLSLA